MYNLLIVEDEEIQRKALCKIIKQLGKQIFVYEACDFNGAIQLCTTKHFDIIFLDLKLEDTMNSSKNGLDIAIYLRSLINSFVFFHPSKFFALPISFSYFYYIFSYLSIYFLKDDTNDLFYDTNDIFTPCSLIYFLLQSNQHTYLGGYYA